MTFVELEQVVKDEIASLIGDARVLISVNDQEVDIRGDEVVTAASIIKIPILLTAGRMADAGLIDLDGVVEVPPSEKVGGTGVVSRLSDGVQLPLKDLAMLMMIVSDNTATNMVIDSLGLDNISRFLAQMQCQGTSLGRRLMDFEARKAGRDNFVSARDIVTMLRALCEEDLLKESTRDWAIRVLKSQQFNHKLPRLIPSGVPGDAFIAHKTGELPGVEHDAGFIERNGHRAYVVILTTGLSNNVSGQEAIGRIGKAVWDHLS